jgi:protein-S-isoprenylcysteine O-methyltransferase Ste14
VRHPMYLAILTMLLFSPLALGSYWAETPVLLTPVFLVMRIRDEEAMLSQQLPGFSEHTQQTRYQLVPWLW